MVILGRAFLLSSDLLRETPNPLLCPRLAPAVSPLLQYPAGDAEVLLLAGSVTAKNLSEKGFQWMGAIFRGSWAPQVPRLLQSYGAAESARCRFTFLNFILFFTFSCTRTSPVPLCDSFRDPGGGGGTNPLGRLRRAPPTAAPRGLPAAPRSPGIGYRRRPRLLLLPLLPLHGIEPPPPPGSFYR